MIKALKEESHLVSSDSPFMDEVREAENFSFEGPYSFLPTKIKSSNGIKDLLLDIFGAH